MRVIARWCHVSMTTARLYKSGVRKPSRTALELFILNRDGCVLDPQEWEDWAVRGDRLVNRAGWDLSQGQLAAYRLVYQLAYDLARRGTPERSELDRIVGAA